MRLDGAVVSPFDERAHSRLSTGQRSAHDSRRRLSSRLYTDHRSPIPHCRYVRKKSTETKHICSTHVPSRACNDAQFNTKHGTDSHGQAAG